VLDADLGSSSDGLGPLQGRRPRGRQLEPLGLRGCNRERRQRGRRRRVLAMLAAGALRRAWLTQIEYPRGKRRMAHISRHGHSRIVWDRQGLFRQARRHTCEALCTCSVITCMPLACKGTCRALHRSVGRTCAAPALASAPLRRRFDTGECAAERTPGLRFAGRRLLAHACTSTDSRAACCATWLSVCAVRTAPEGAPSAWQANYSHMEDCSLQAAEGVGLTTPL